MHYTNTRFILLYFTLGNIGGNVADRHFVEYKLLFPTYALSCLIIPTYKLISLLLPRLTIARTGKALTKQVLIAYSWSIGAFHKTDYLF